MSRIGIFGGTFNPPHIGHTRLAEHFVSELKLDRLLVIPTYQPPHKSADNLASGEDRINMCMLAFPDAVISTVEMNRGGKSYTYDTLCEIKEQYPGDELFFIVGSDMLLSFNRWYRSEEILDMITLCAADREDDGAELEMPEFLKGKRVIITKLPPFELSSTQIRECVSKGESTQGMLDEAVRFYIDEKGLYR